MKLSVDDKTNLLLGLFVASVIGANLLGSKITTLAGINTSVGIFLYPLSFLATDIVGEVHGRKKATQFVWVAFCCVLFILVMTTFFVFLPFAKRSYVQADQYTPVFGISLRFFMASVVAFLMSQYHDVWAFDFWKGRTKGRWLWLRNNASTMVSQLIDTVVFMYLALLYIPGLPSVINTSPNYSPGFVFTLVIPYYLLKVVVALLDTPLCYLGVRWLRGKTSGQAAHHGSPGE